jgi:hypothetical protein
LKELRKVMGVSRVLSAPAVSVDGYITGRGPGPGRGLGAGRPYFQGLPAHIQLRLIEAVAAPGVTHLHYAVER